MQGSKFQIAAPVHFGGLEVKRGPYNILRCDTVAVHRILTVNFFRHILIGLTRSEKTSVMSTVKRPGTHIWQICWQIYPPPVDLPVDLNGDFRFLLLEPILADQLADLPPSSSI